MSFTAAPWSRPGRSAWWCATWCSGAGPSTWAWASGFDPSLLGLFAGEAELLNDDRVGRALDELFLADRASLTTALSLAAISAYGVSLDELHNHSTSICLYGAYRGATGGARGGVTPSRPTWGHSKDHRPDLKQLAHGTAAFRWRSGTPT